MKRHKALQSLSHDHHHGLRLAQLIKKGNPEYKGLPQTSSDKKLYIIKFFKENLIRHFKKEEEILFPLSREKNSNVEKLIDELIEEQKKIYLIIDKLKISTKPEVELDNLGKLLDAHIRKEERELFQIIQKILSENELEKLETDLGEAMFECEL